VFRKAQHRLPLTFKHPPKGLGIKPQGIQLRFIGLAFIHLKSSKITKQLGIKNKDNKVAVIQSNLRPQATMGIVKIGNMRPFEYESNAVMGQKMNALKNDQ